MNPNTAPPSGLKQDQKPAPSEQAGYIAQIYNQFIAEGGEIPSLPGKLGFNMIYPYPAPKKLSRKDSPYPVIFFALSDGELAAMTRFDLPNNEKRILLVNPKTGHLFTTQNSPLAPDRTGNARPIYEYIVISMSEMVQKTTAFTMEISTGTLTKQREAFIHAACSDILGRTTQFQKAQSKMLSAFKKLGADDILNQIHGRSNTQEQVKSHIPGAQPER